MERRNHVRRYLFLAYPEIAPENHPLLGLLTSNNFLFIFTSFPSQKHGGSPPSKLQASPPLLLLYTSLSSII
jgi:hypothetical protein